MSEDSRFRPPEFPSSGDPVLAPASEASSLPTSEPLPELNLSGPVASTAPAGFWIRVGASIVDNLILGVVVGPISFGILIAQRLFKDNVPMILGLMALSWTVQIGSIYFYYGWFYAKKGATPGKMVLNLKVLDANTGAHLTSWRAFWRETVGKFFSAITLFIGYIIAGLRSDKRALHDLMFETQVIRKR